MPPPSTVEQSTLPGLGERKVVVYEPLEVAENLKPLTLTRPVFLLKVGPRTILEEVSAVLGPPSALYTRGYLAGLTSKSTGVPVNPRHRWRDAVVVSGAFVPLLGELECGRGEVFTYGGKVAYACLEELAVEDSARFEESVLSLAEKLGQQELKKAFFADKLWVLPKLPLHTIPAEARRLAWKPLKPEGVVVAGDSSQLYVHPGSRIIPPVTVNTEKGPVIVESGAVVGPFTYIEGPAYIGPSTTVRAGTVIRRGTSVGELCRIGGEISESIVHGRSNKAHDGFLGDSYVGEWVNIAAGAITGNLRNDYGEVKLYTPKGPVSTGETKVGSFIGDHSRVSIGTMLNAGTIIGVATSVIAPEMAPKYIPSFTRYYKARLEDVAFEEALAAISRMMGRRGASLSEEEIGALRYIYEATAEEREFYKKFYSERNKSR